MTTLVTLPQWILGFLLLFSSLGVIILKKPVHACLAFLLSLLALAALYLQLSANFIAVMQILVYAGAILVIFMFVIILFQDAHEQIERFKAEASPYLLGSAAFILLISFLLFASRLTSIDTSPKELPTHYGTVQTLGKTLYLDFFFPFEAVILLFLVAIVGALYIGKKGK